LPSLIKSSSGRPKPFRMNRDLEALIPLQK